MQRSSRWVEDFATAKSLIYDMHACKILKKRSVFPVRLRLFIFGSNKYLTLKEIQDHIRLLHHLNAKEMFKDHPLSRRNVFMVTLSHFF